MRSQNTGTYSAACTTCSTVFAINPNFAFVVLHVICPRCKSTVVFLNPRYSSEHWKKFPTCLDCGDPIPPSRIGSRDGRTYKLQRTCPKCWRNHRNDEPGAEVLSIADLRPRVSSIS